ncbi:MAG: hypothetical protein AAB864_02025 [Patescibacteria group bacterium]
MNHRNSLHSQAIERLLEAAFGEDGPQVKGDGEAALYLVRYARAHHGFVQEHQQDWGVMTGAIQMGWIAFLTEPELIETIVGIQAVRTDHVRPEAVL